jgi:hypothetical protein
LSRWKRAWKRFDRFFGRWSWLIFLLLAIANASQGDAVLTAGWGLLAGVHIERRRRPGRPRNEIRIGLSKDEADEIRRAALPTEGAE